MLYLDPVSSFAVLFSGTDGIPVFCVSGILFVNGCRASCGLSINDCKCCVCKHV